MSRYFATFITGCQNIIQQRLNEFSKAQLSIVELQDGLVIFDSSLSVNQLAELRFFNNVYALLYEARGISMDEFIHSAADADFGVVPRVSSFTLRVFDANQPVHADTETLKKAITAHTGGTPTAHKPDTTFAVHARADGQGLFGWQLPGGSQRAGKAGELRSELAHILGLVASLKPGDSVLDPFAGYGAIVREALHGFHVGRAVAVEQNQEHVRRLKTIQNLQIIHGDARHVVGLEKGSIDRVITDPPWGNFDEQPDLTALYQDSLTEMHRVLKTKGCVVMLSAAPFVPEVATQAGFATERSYPILVSGRKATIYKLRKQ